MKHTRFYDAIKAIEEQANHELAEAVKAVGGTFTPDYEEEEVDEIIVVGAFKHCPNSEDILVTKVTVSEYGNPIIYGKSYECREMDDVPIYFLEAGYIGYIIDAIPETVDIKDVTDAEASLKTAEIVTKILTGKKHGDRQQDI